MNFFNIFKRLDIRLSIELWILCTLIYYWLYIFSIEHLTNFCKNEFPYCIDFLPYGDFLAAYIAIVGLYFVVSSLDDWKQQHKLNNTLIAIQEIIAFKKELNNYIDNLSSILDLGEEYKNCNSILDAIKKKYYLINNELKIRANYNSLEKSVLVEKEILESQKKDIEKILGTLDEIIRGIDKEIYEIKQYDNDVSFNRLMLQINKPYKAEIDKIITNNQIILRIVQTGIDKVSKNTNIILK